MKCPNCGAILSEDTKFCTTCGNDVSSIHKSKSSSSLDKSPSNILDFILSKPKLIAVIVIIFIVFLALIMMGGNSDGYSDNGGYVTEIFGVSFHIPDGFEESYHSGPFSSGETVDFKSDDYDDLEIEVSPAYNVNLNSNHVKVKTQKNIGGKDGTLVYYDSNRVSFYYEDNGYTIKLNTNSPNHDELFDSVII